MSLQNTKDDLGTGDTSISRRNPNSLSHTTDIVENMELKRTVIPTMPGNMNCMYWAPDFTSMSFVNPEPTITSQMRGRIMVTTSLHLWRKNRLNSLKTI